jgi:hypothetical protein
MGIFVGGAEERDYMDCSERTDIVVSEENNFDLLLHCTGGVHCY